MFILRRGLMPQASNGLWAPQRFFFAAARRRSWRLRSSSAASASDEASEEAVYPPRARTCRWASSRLAAASRRSAARSVTTFTPFIQTSSEGSSTLAWTGCGKQRNDLSGAHCLGEIGGDLLTLGTATNPRSTCLVKNRVHQIHRQIAALLVVVRKEGTPTTGVGILTLGQRVLCNSGVRIRNILNHPQHLQVAQMPAVVV